MKKTISKYQRIVRSLYLTFWRGGGYGFVVAALSVIPFWPGTFSLFSLIASSGFGIGLLLKSFWDEYTENSTRDMTFTTQVTKYIPLYLIAYTIWPWWYFHHQNFMQELPSLALLWIVSLTIFLLRPVVPRHSQ